MVAAAIFATAIGAYFGLPVWITFVATFVLLACAVTEQFKLITPSAHITHYQIILFGAWQRIGHALAASGAAYALGYITRLGF